MTGHRVGRRAWRKRASRGLFATCALVLSGCGVEPAPRAAGPPASSPPRASAHAAPPPAAPADPSSQSAHRNVLLITLDTLRADALGAYQPGLATSPHLDRLAAQGVLFEQVTTSSPSTLPSHASLFTGRHPYGHGARANSGYVLADSQATVAEAFQAAGYATGAEVSTLVIARRKGLAQGFDYYRDPDSQDVERKQLVVGGAGRAAAEARFLDERPADDVTRHGIAFLERQRAKPFFLWLHYFDPHATYAAPPAFARRFPDSPYHAEVAYTDAAVGRVIAALERLGLAGSTLVVVTSDHGEGLGEHGEPTHSFLVYDTTMRVPLLLWGPPDLPRGRRVTALVRSIDVAPTLLRWAGLPPLPDAEGEPLQPLFAAEAGTPRLAYGESIEPRAAFGGSVLRFLRSGPWKYIHKPDPELYDVGRDPRERENRASSESGRVAALRERLEALLAGTRGAAAEGAVAVDPEEAARLAALGYVASAGSAARVASPTAGEDLRLTGIDPNRALADFSRLGVAYRVFEVERDYERAAALYADLGERYPESLPVLRGWVDSLRMLGRQQELLPLAERAVALAPDDPVLRLKLVEALEATGRLPEAEAHVRTALAAKPCGDLEVAYLSRVLRARGRFAEQRDALRRAYEGCDSDGVRNEYAYLLATSPLAAARDGAAALRIAQGVVSKPGNARPEFLDTLAAAHAELGQYEQAARIQRQVLEALRTRALPESSLAVFREHLTAFEAGRPVREPATQPVAPEG